MLNTDHTLTTIPFLELLRNQIDITRVPFSDQGSRLVVYRSPGESQLYIKLADLEPGIDAYICRPPYIQDLVFVDENGAPSADAAIFIDLALKATADLNTQASQLPK